MLSLLDFGLLGIIILVIIFIILLPIILTLIVGAGFANYFGFTGITWYAFLILFWFFVVAVFAALGV